MLDIEITLEWPSLEFVPRHFLLAVSSALESLQLYHATGARDEFTKWQEILSGIIQDRRFAHANPSFRAGIFYRYGVSLQWRGVMFDSTHDFREAEEYWLRAAELTLVGSSLNLRSRYNIALALTNAYRASGEPKLLDDAVSIMEKCTKEVPLGLPETALCWEGLSWALERRYAISGKTTDLSLSVDAAERCVRQMPLDSPRAVRYLSRLAGALKRKFDVFGDIEDINRSIEIYTDLWKRIPKDSADLVGYLGGASAARRARYEVTSQLSDISAAQEINSARLERSIPGSRSQETVLNESGLTLRRLFEARGERGDIEMAIRHHREAVNAVAESHQHYPGNVSNLGNALMARYYAYRDECDLDDAIDAYRSAVQSSVYHNSTEAMNRQYNLATALIEKYRDVSSPQIKATIDGLLKIASEQGLQTLPNIAMRAAVARGRWHEAEQRFGEAAQAYDCALRAAQQLFRQQNGLSNKIVRLRQRESLPNSAAFSHAQAGSYTQAVLAIEQGRALLFTESLERKTVELNALIESGHADLVARYRAAALLLDVATRQAESANHDIWRKPAIGFARDE